MKRRTFVHFGTLAAASPFLASCGGGKANGPDVAVAVIGLKGRGKDHLKDLKSAKGAKLVALCDVDSRELEKYKAEEQKTSSNLATYADYRKLLENKDVQGVIIATPNHTHTLIALAAIAAGKHVYVEKPVSHNIAEGRMLVEAAVKRPNIVVQHGMQRRSEVCWKEAAAYLNTGKLGKVLISRGINWKPREAIEQLTGAAKIHKAIDQNLWFGPREIKMPTRGKFHYDWHWFWEYGNGDIGNQGPHQFDVARMALGDPSAPTNVLSVGNRWGYQDGADTPNCQLAFYDYGNGQQLIFDNRGLPKADMKYNKDDLPLYKDRFNVGNAIECENGWIGERYVYDKDGNELEKFSGTDGPAHLQAWLDSIRAGKLTDATNLSIEVGHQAALLAHLANISYRVGQLLPVEQLKERLKGNAAASATWDSLQANLAANKIDLAATQPKLGAPLTFDPVKETFTGEFAQEANLLAQGSYREEFKLPEIT
jgi:predicted dehydrogenase